MKLKQQLEEAQSILQMVCEPMYLKSNGVRKSVGHVFSRELIEDRIKNYFSNCGLTTDGVKKLTRREINNYLGR